MSLQGQTVFITGASSGIGEALAREYARLGANLVLTARRVDRLEALASDLAFYNRKVLFYPADVTRAGDLEKAVEAALTEVPSIDIVIANAGFGVAGSFESLRLEDYERQFSTNVFGVLRTISATLPALKKSRGRLVMMGSALGHIALPGNSAYAMSKWAIRALAESLWHELGPLGIRVTHISPGFIATEIRKVDNRGRYLAQASDPIPQWLCASPQKAARTIVRAVRRGAKEKSITAHAWILIRLAHHFPGLTHGLIRALKIRARPQPDSAGMQH